ncbi:hypothetical protein LPJ56_002010, partial [Coemansia sp. RSA 2599]
ELPFAQSDKATDQSSGKVDPSSFFRPGKLGNFGSGGIGAFKSGTGAFGNFSSQSASATSTSSTGLPNAFSSVSKTPSALPEFGAKLDRPAFGVLSMSSKASFSADNFKKAVSAGSLAYKLDSLAKNSAGGGSNPFGSKIDDKAQSKLDSEAPEKTMSNKQFGTYRSRDSSTGGDARSAQNKEEDVDPLKRLIYDSDDGYGVSSANPADIDYESD